MAITLATNTQNAGCDGQVDLLDAGVGTAQCRIYDGSRPASANDGIGAATLLVAVDLPNPAFGAAANGVASLLGTPLSGTGEVGAGAGTAATWARFVDRDGGTVFDGEVGGSGSGAVIELDNVSIADGQNVSITGGTYTQPSGE